MASMGLLGVLGHQHPRVLVASHPHPHTLFSILFIEHGVVLHWVNLFFSPFEKESTFVCMLNIL